MKLNVIILLILCLGAITLQAQETTAGCSDTQIRQTCDCGCKQHPINDYEGLNLLRQRLANPSWDGKIEPFRSIGTGMKVENGKIVPLSKKPEIDNVNNSTLSSKTSVRENVTVKPTFIHQMESGEELIGAPVFVFFRLAGTYVMDSSQLLNVNAAADLAIAQNLSVRIIGAADSATGSATKNETLAKARAEYVASIMKKRGVPEYHIEILSQGGTALYEPVSANRNCRIELLAMDE
jgi:outer membrane protein OmpA-like peptidoglycan-associated protein